MHNHQRSLSRKERRQMLRQQRRKHTQAPQFEYEMDDTVPYREVGEGPYCYVRISPETNQFEVQRYETHAQAQAAMDAGIAKDEALCAPYRDELKH